MAEAYVFLVILLSSFLQTTTGFGYAIITAPLLSLVLSAKETVMLVMLTAPTILYYPTPLPLRHTKWHTDIFDRQTPSRAYSPIVCRKDGFYYEFQSIIWTLSK